MHRIRTRGLFIASAVSVLGFVACSGAIEPGEGDGFVQAHSEEVTAEQEGAAFGPVESRAFHWFSGTSIERAPDDTSCNYNSDWLIVHGPDVASAKLVDVSPRTYIWYKGSFPLSGCVAPDCLAIYVKTTSRDEPGTRTLTLKHADGRTATTTFDVIENEGRCDYPRGKVGTTPAR
jgi:hypothetical protein